MKQSSNYPNAPSLVTSISSSQMQPMLPQQPPTPGGQPAASNNLPFAFGQPPPPSVTGPAYSMQQQQQELVQSGGPHQPPVALPHITHQQQQQQQQQMVSGRTLTAAGVISSPSSLWFMAVFMSQSVYLSVTLFDSTLCYTCRHALSPTQPNGWHCK